jgi:DNA-directed RNA polymerase subunit omega
VLRPAAARDPAGHPTRLDIHPDRKAAHVISPRIDRLLEQVDSNYAGVIVAAKRARQINSYYHNLGEGTFDEFPPPMIETGSKNYLTIALEEVAAGKMKYHYRGGSA